MRSRIEGARALRLANISAVIGAGVVANSATAKGQRSELAKIGKRQSEEIVKLVWQAPSSFVDFALSEGHFFESLAEAEIVARGDDREQALVALRSLAGYRSYKSERFDEAFTVCDVARLEKREIGYQRSGGINLGLAGYSAEDVVQMAIVRSWNDSLVRYLAGTGSVSSDDVEDLRGALNRRSLLDFTDAREASDFTRYSVTVRNGYTMIIKRDVSKMNDRIVRQAEAFDELKTMLNEQAGRLEFTIGDVYRNILKVRREGVASIRRMLDGHTIDGTFTPSVEASVSERSTYAFRSSVEANLEASLLVASAEDDFISRRFTITEERSVLIDGLKKQITVPMEAEAVTFLTLLNEGYSLEELAEDVFADLTPRRFGEVQRTAQNLARTIQR